MEKGYYKWSSTNGKKKTVSQSTIKMEKGYYYHLFLKCTAMSFRVAIHNKNGKGLLQPSKFGTTKCQYMSQSTIKMEKGYYQQKKKCIHNPPMSQSTIKMEKGYY